METSHTTAQYDRYNMLYEIELFLSPTTDTTRNGCYTTALLMKTNASDSYDKYNKNECIVPECTSLFPSEATDTTIWKPKIQNCRTNRIDLCLRYTGLVSYDRQNRYNYTETQDTQLLYESHRVVFALQGASFIRQTQQIQLYGNQA